MSQPIWKFVANLGEATPLEYGGLFVYTDETGVYPPEMERLEPLENGKFDLRRVCLDPCTYEDGVLSDNSFHPTLDAWFADDLDLIASCIGVEHHSLVKQLTSADPVQLARGYEAIGDYHGWENLDEYPLTLTKAEVLERYTQGELS